jgi:transcriptional regulator
METIDNCLESSRILLELGKSYVLFFCENPLYYRFLFSIDNIDIDDYPPFGLFKSIAEKELKGMLGDKADDFIIHAKVIALWSLVHGLSSIVTIRGVLDADNIEAEVELVLGSINV